MPQSVTPFEPVERPLRLAQIGAGYWGPNLIRNFVQAEGVGSLTVCDREPARLEKIKRQHPHVKVTTEAAAVLSDPEIDGVILAVPASGHHRMAMRALSNGKHVFVEKPLAATLAEAEEMVNLARQERRILMVGHTFLFNVAVRRVKEYIDSGELGQIYYILAQRLNLGRVRDDVNAWWNLAPHDISIIHYWLGETPSRVTAKGFTFLQDGIEDVVFSSLDFSSGCAAHIHVSWLDPVKTRRVVVVGSKKMLVYDDVSSESKITLYDKGIDKKDIVRNLPDIESFASFHFENRYGEIRIPHLRFQEPLALECQHFVECIQEGKEPLTSGESGLDVVRVLEDAQRSLKGDSQWMK